MAQDGALRTAPSRNSRSSAMTSATMTRLRHSFSLKTAEVASGAADPVLVPKFSLSHDLAGASPAMDGFVGDNRSSNRRSLPHGVESELIAFCLREAQGLQGNKAEPDDADASEAAKFRQQLEGLVTKYKPDIATVTLKYKDLCVETDALVGSAAIPTVGDSFKHLLGRLIGKKPPVCQQSILHNLSGVIEPARLTLLLGPPGSGKSALLKVLAGRYSSSNGLRVTGDVTYNGQTLDTFCVQRTAGHVNQIDVHLPQLTVLDTLMFAYKTQNGCASNDFNLFAALRNAIAQHKGAAPAGSQESPVDGPEGTDHEADHEEQILAMGEELYHSEVKVANIMQAFGILNAQHTPVGSAVSRGVSGGERKRLTLAEMMLGPRRVLLLDEISNGLDSATLFSIMTHLRDYTHTFHVTCLVSLLQPTPEVYNLFDDLCLLSQGHVVYHGPTSDAVSFFSSLGFVCPARKDVPSFLQEITTPSGQQEFAVDLLRTQGRTAISTEPFLIPVEEIAHQFWQSTAGKSMKAKLAASLDLTHDHRAALARTKHALSCFQAFKVALRLQLSLVIQKKAMQIMRLMQSIIVGILLGVLFYQTEKSVLGARSLVGAFMLSIMVTSLSSSLQLIEILGSRNVWYKWRDNNFYSAWSHLPAVALAQLPMSLLDTLVWTLITYLMWGLHLGAAQFLIHWFILLCMSLYLNAMFRCVAFLVPNASVAFSYGGLLWSLYVLLSGYAIVRDQIPSWWMWAYFSSPFAWTVRALCINEFRSPGWQGESLNSSGRTLGEVALSQYSLFSDKTWIWGAVAFLLGSMVCLDIMSIQAAQYYTPPVVSRIADEKEVAAARQKAAQIRKPATKNMKRVKSFDDGASRIGAAWITNPVADVEDHHALPDHDVRGSYDSEVNKSGLSSCAFTPITLVFQNLRYSVPNPAFKQGAASSQGLPVPDRLELLKGITGFAQPGVLTALMGGTGAGKTTLMNCIAGRTTIGTLCGQLTVNGRPKDQSTWSRVVGYCEQNDVHTPAQTIRDALLFSARLRLPRSMTKDQVCSHVEDVMSMLELTTIQFNLVGQQGNGLSLEQRKRLTIGVELVANPSVVFMDEPTSGLDARSAAIVMKVVKNVSRTGRTTMVTIHQPSTDIFEAFDQLLLLQLGGRVSYFGALGARSQQLIHYLQQVPGCPPIVDGTNPATYLLEVTGGAVAVTAKTVDVDWAELYLHSQLAEANESKAARLVDETCWTSPLVIEGGMYASTTQSQFTALAVKHLTAYWRNPAYNFTRFVTTLLSAVMFGTIWYNAGKLPGLAEPKHVQTLMGIINTCVMALGNVNMMTIIPIMSLEREVFYREQAASMYSPWVYSLTVTTVESPWILAQVLLFIGVLYPLVGLQHSAASFLWYLFICWQSLSYYASLGMMLAFVTPDVMLGSLLGNTLKLLFGIFDGFMLPAPSMPAGLRWINRIVPSSWAMHGLAGSQLLTSDTPLALPFETSIQTVRQFVEAIYGYSVELHWLSPLIMFAFIASARIAAVLALRYISFLRQ